MCYILASSIYQRLELRKTSCLVVYTAHPTTTGVVCLAPLKGMPQIYIYILCHHFPMNWLGAGALLHQEKSSGYPPFGSGSCSWLDCAVALPRQITPNASAWRAWRKKERQTWRSHFLPPSSFTSLPAPRSSKSPPLLSAALSGD